MSDAVREFEIRGYEITVKYDQSPESPREWSNLGTISQPLDYGKHYGYNRIRDKDTETNREYLAEILAAPGCVYLEVGVNGRGGVYSFANTFNDESDAVIYCTRETWRKEYSRTRMSKQLRANIETVLRAEIEAFSNYRTGDVFGVVATDPATGKSESLWGIYTEAGSPDDPYIDEVAAELCAELDHEAATAREQFAAAMAEFDAAPILSAA